MTKEVDRAELANTTGPAPAGDVIREPCQACGRSELVKTTMPKEDDARATQQIVDAAGDEVKPGASVTVCALCGAIQTSRSLQDGGRTAARATRKRKASSRKPKAQAKRTSTRRTTSTRRRSTSKTAARRRTTNRRGR